MTALKEMKRQAIETVEKRAFEARVTMSAVCARAGLAPQVWGSAKMRGSIGVDLLSKIETALGELEVERLK